MTGYADKAKSSMKSLLDGKDRVLLSIESSCDETSVALVRDDMQVLAQVTATQIDTHALYGGVVPEIASRIHIESIGVLTEQCLAQAGMTIKDIDAVAVTSAPGLVGALLVGVSYGKALAWSLGVPLIGVHHIEGHICANFITHRQLKPPFLSLVISGGHTQLIDVMDYCSYRLLGGTRDDAAGEAFDKGARILGLPYPGGRQIDELAQRGDDHAFSFPIAKLKGNQLDFSFSGVKTALFQFIGKQNEDWVAEHLCDIAASYQRAIVEALVENTAHAARLCGRRQVVLAGGVAANSAVRCRMEQRLSEMNAALYYPEPALCADNAAMIGCAGWLRLQRGQTDGLNLNAVPSRELIDHNII